MLSEDQKRHYDTFGFVILPGLFSAAEWAKVKREAEAVFAEVHGDKWANPEERLSVSPFFERRPYMASLMSDDRIYGIGEDLLGPDFVLDGTEGHRHVGDTHWHGGQGKKPIVHIIKIAFYLDPLTKDTGALRLIPGSHTPAFGAKLKEYQGFSHNPDVLPFGIPHEEIPCVAFEPQVGDVAVFTEPCYHASYGGYPGRYQLAVNFFENPTTKEQVEDLWMQYERAHWSFRPLRSHVESDDPRRRRMVARLLELGHETLEH